MNRKIIILIFLFISINFVYAIDGLTFSTLLDRKHPNEAYAITVQNSLNEPARYEVGDKLFWNYSIINRKIKFRTSVCFYLKDLKNDKTYDITELILRIVNKQKGCTDENNNPTPSAPSYCPIRLDNMLIGTSNQEATGNILRHVFTPTSLPNGEYELVAQLREPNVECSNPSSTPGSIISENVITAVPIAESVNYFKYIKRGVGSTTVDNSLLRNLLNICNKKNFKVAFILLSKETVNPGYLEKINKIKDKFSEDFSYATENLATLDISYPVSVVNFNSLTSVTSTGAYYESEVTKEFYRSNPDDFDFIVIYTDLDVFESPYSVRVINYLDGIDHSEFNPNLEQALETIDNSKSYGSNHKLLGYMVMNTIKERTPGLFSDEEATIRRSGALLHELGHNWCCYIWNPNLNLDRRLHITDSGHWNPYFDHGPSPLALHSSRTYWQDEGNGVFSSSIDFNLNRQKYHPFTLYFMGLKRPEEITQSFKIITPEGSEWVDENTKKIFIKGAVDYITINDIISAMGPRRCRFDYINLN